MTRTQYAEIAFNLFNEGKISEDAYDAMMLNIDCFIDDDEEIWEAVDAESSIEIYLDDLKPEVKAKVMKILDIGEDEENYDLFSLFIIPATSSQTLSLV